MIELLIEPFQFEFFRNGTMAAVLAGALCGLIGVYIVLRGMSYIGHGLSHAIFGGAVVAYVMQWNFYLGAGMWGFLAALLINQTVRKTQINADAAIGVITTASFAVGVALISRYRSFTRSFDAALFGNILGVTSHRCVGDRRRQPHGRRVDLLRLSTTALHHLRRRSRPGLRRAHTLDRHALCLAAGGDADCGATDPGRHLDRRRARHPGHHGPAAHRQLQPHHPALHHHRRA